jgi:hypothetical protein
VARESRNSHLARMIDAQQLSEQLGGQITPHTLRKWARQGRVAGAVRLGHKVLFDARSASWIVEDLGLPAKVFGGNGTS